MKAGSITTARIVLALIALSPVFWGTSQRVVADPIPTPIAQATASAEAAGGPSSSDSDADPVTATVNVTSSGDDFAEAMAEATVGDRVRSRSATSGASGQSVPSQGAGTAGWISNLIATGTDPGTDIDIDLATVTDGLLDYLNNNSGASADDIRSSVSLTLTVYDEAGATTAFDGSAQLAAVTNSDPPELTRSGDWAAPGRDGDFSTAGCSAFSCAYNVNLSDTFEDVTYVGFQRPFAIEFELATTAYTFAGFEVEAIADFFNTGSVVVATDTPGITFQIVPEPTSLLLFAAEVVIWGVSSLQMHNPADPTKRH